MVILDTRSCLVAVSFYLLVHATDKPKADTLTTLKRPEVSHYSKQNAFNHDTQITRNMLITSVL